MGLLDACDISTQDRIVLKVAECLEFDEVEGCGMCDGNKIGRSAIGELARSSND